MVPALRDGSTERPIPSAWRPLIREICGALARGDHGLSTIDAAHLEPVSAATAVHIRDSVRDYGATLVELPEQSWESSVCIWQGSRWTALVDLWSAEEGRSDLVLSLLVTPLDAGENEFRFEVHMVYTP